MFTVPHCKRDEGGGEDNRGFRNPCRRVAASQSPFTGTNRRIITKFHLTTHEPSSLLPPHSIPLGRPSAPAPSIQYRASNLVWQLISYMIFYMFQCHSPKSSKGQARAELRMSGSRHISHTPTSCSYPGVRQLVLKRFPARLVLAPHQYGESRLCQTVLTCSERAF